MAKDRLGQNELDVVQVILKSDDNPDKKAAQIKEDLEPFDIVVEAVKVQEGGAKITIVCDDGTRSTIDVPA